MPNGRAIRGGTSHTHIWVVKIKQHLNKLSNLLRRPSTIMWRKAGATHVVGSKFELISTWVHATRQHLHRTYACMRLMAAVPELMLHYGSVQLALLRLAAMEISAKLHERTSQMKLAEVSGSGSS